MENKKSVFETLSAINVSGKTEKKNVSTHLITPRKFQVL